MTFFILISKMATYIDLNADFRTNANQSNVLITDIQNVKSSLERLLLTGKGEVPFLGDLLVFNLVYNKGAAWGMGGDNLFTRILLVIISWLVAVGIIGYFVGVECQKRLKRDIKTARKVCEELLSILQDDKDDK